ncbi:inositol-tetrakisphosphate 1-kinase-like [Actinia tenebrosa]|uniref:Inositol-tetrakisphosphate 1-kinase n=1 Tax=Actinia tenebrosa TaxID=6105 RepID=A0A6P8J4Q5_ACTTE|nr:inositol-tetrakisphosphate 1-kinase-like [Actinia tenebrosa]
MSSTTKQLFPLSMGRKRVGLLLSPKKKRKSVFDSFIELCSETGIELIEIDLNIPLEDQGPFDIILQKITDYMAQATDGDEHALKTIQSLEHYLDCHPEVKVLDPLDCVQKLCNRLVSYQVMKQCEFIEDGIRTYMPNFVRIDSTDLDENIRRIRTANVQFPMVCKPLIGHGSDQSHRMSLLFNEDGLKDVTPPCVVQHFVNHNAILYKVFVAANHYHTVDRPSIKNFYKKKDNQPTIFFNSHDVSKAESSSHLSQLDEIDNTGKATPTDEVVVAKIVNKLQNELGLSMFGIDIVIEKGTSNHVVIDINYFPGYEGAPSFPADMVNYINQILFTDQNGV